jgi:hypothetical protein
MNAALLVDHRVAKETGGDDEFLVPLREFRVGSSGFRVLRREEVAGDLFDDELVVGLVFVE